MVTPWHLAQCDNCKFEFHGGHDHHTFSEAFLCLGCLSLYELVTRCEFGPEPNELVPIYRLVEKKKWFRSKTRERLATTSLARAVPGEIQVEGQKVVAAVAYDLGDFQCQCGENSFAFDLTQASYCPKCKTASLKVSDVIY